MNSDQDLLSEGFPHSEIRGSTIARISPRLIAACHVLHRLLAPRHPPNALLSLHHTITARAQGQIAPHVIVQILRDLPPLSPKAGARRTLIRNHIHIHQIRFTTLKSKPQPAPRKRPIMRQAPGPSGNPLVFPCRPNREHHGGSRIRTGDPLLAKQVLYQLSYAPLWDWMGVVLARGRATTPCVAGRFSLPPGDFRLRRKWAREDLNLRPHAYQACALTN